MRCLGTIHSLTLTSFVVPAECFANGMTTHSCKPSESRVCVCVCVFVFMYMCVFFSEARVFAWNLLQPSQSALSFWEMFRKRMTVASQRCLGRAVAVGAGILVVIKTQCSFVSSLVYWSEVGERSLTLRQCRRALSTSTARQMNSHPTTTHAKLSLGCFMMVGRLDPYPNSKYKRQVTTDRIVMRRGKVPSEQLTVYSTNKCG